uniref:Uncharacterized protein n=1 Tax=Arundo donax TaxID=35708 RepID=A0A0A9A6E9_ARUDO
MLLYWSDIESELQKVPVQPLKKTLLTCQF